MTIYVTEPYKRYKNPNRVRKPEAVLPRRAGKSLQYLVDMHPEAIYFSDDPDADFGEFVFPSPEMAQVEATLPAVPHVALKTSDWEVIQRVVRAYLPSLEVFEPETAKALNEMKVQHLEVS